MLDREVSRSALASGGGIEPPLPPVLADRLSMVRPKTPSSANRPTTREPEALASVGGCAPAPASERTGLEGGGTVGTLLLRTGAETGVKPAAGRSPSNPEPAKLSPPT